MSRTNSLAVRDNIALQGEEKSHYSVHLVNRTPERGTCALRGCRRRSHANGICRDHEGYLLRLLDQLVVIGLELTEMIATPGVRELEQMEGAHPMVNQACAFLNRAAAAWEDIAAIDAKKEIETPVIPMTREMIRRAENVEGLTSCAYGLRLRLQDLTSPSVLALLPSLRSSEARIVERGVQCLMTQKGS